jgi:hypothetical protein
VIKEDTVIEARLRDYVDRRGGVSMTKHQPVDSPWADLRFGLVWMGSRMLFKYVSYPLLVGPGRWRTATTFKFVVPADQASRLREWYGFKAPTAWSTDPMIADVMRGGWVNPYRAFVVDGRVGDLDGSLMPAIESLERRLLQYGPRALIEQRRFPHSPLHRLPAEVGSERYLAGDRRLGDGVELRLVNYVAGEGGKETPGDFEVARAMLGQCVKRIGRQGPADVARWYRHPSDDHHVGIGFDLPVGAVVVELDGTWIGFGWPHGLLLNDVGKLVGGEGS